MRAPPRWNSAESIDRPCVVGARAGVRFALVRAGWGGYEGGIEEGFDPRFAANSTGARAAGLGVGAYLYSYMKTPAAAHAAAAGFLRLALPFSPDYPLVLDFEDSPTYAGQSKSKNTDIARTFLEDLEAGVSERTGEPFVPRGETPARRAARRPLPEHLPREELRREPECCQGDPQRQIVLPF